MCLATEILFKSPMRVSNALIVDLAQDGQFIMMVGLALIRLTYVREIVMMAGHHETRLSRLP